MYFTLFKWFPNRGSANAIEDLELGLVKKTL